MIAGTGAAGVADIHVEVGAEGIFELGTADDDDPAHVVGIGSDLERVGQGPNCVVGVTSKCNDAQVKSSFSCEGAACDDGILVAHVDDSVDAAPAGDVEPGAYAVPTDDETAGERQHLCSELAHKAEPDDRGEFTKLHLRPPDGVQGSSKEHGVGALCEGGFDREGNTEITRYHSVVSMQSVAAADTGHPIAGLPLIDAVTCGQDNAGVRISERPALGTGIGIRSPSGKPVPATNLAAGTDE